MNIYIHQHLGLGDMILCNGLVRHMLDIRGKKTKFFIFCRVAHIKSIKFMYRDERRIKIIPISNNPKKEKSDVKSYLKKLRAEDEFVKIGHEFYKETSNLNLDNNYPWPCDYNFYKQFNVPFTFRFTKCYWKRDKVKEKKLFNKLVGKKKDYIFIHDDPKRGLVIENKNINKRYKIIRNNYKYSIFDYSQIIENAKEIHLMESSFRQLCETLNTSKSKLFLYKGRSFDHSVELYNRNKKKWIGTSKKWHIIRNNIQVLKKSRILNNFFKR